MKCRFSSAIAVFSFAAFAAAQPRDSSVFTHTYNNLPVIKAYHLSAEQEAGFSTTDGHLSCFWRAWDLPGANALDSLIVKSDSSTTAWGPVETPEDATIKLKLAWGDSGLYMLFEVIDDAWIGYVSPIDYENDCVEFFLDPHSGRQLYSPGTPYFTAVDISQLNVTFIQFQFRFGGNPPSIEMTMHQWSAELVAQGCTQPRQCEPYIRYMIDIPIDPLAFGIKIEAIPSRSDQTNIRQQEWMIPWKYYGNSSSTHPPPAENDRLAICVGYNDRDDGLEPSASAIRWRNAADPYTTATNPATNKITTVDSWGEIEFVGDLLTAAGLTQSELDAGCVLVCKQPRIKQPGRAVIQNAKYFTLSGRRAMDARAVPLHTILLQRDVSGNGMVNVRKVMASRSRRNDNH